MPKAKFILDDNDIIKSEFLTKDNSDNLFSGINNSGTSEKLLSQLLAYQISTHSFSTVKEALDYLLSETIQITSFEISKDGVNWSKHIVGEIGEDPITPQVHLRWTLNKDPQSITINGVPFTSSNYSIVIPTPDLDESRTYTLHVTDNVGNTTTSTVNAYVWWKFYYGTYDEAITTPFNITDLLNTTGFSNELVSNPRGVYTFDCTGGKYIYFIINDDWLPVKFIHEGLEVNLEEVDVFFNNESGGPYNGTLYRTTYKLHGDDVTIVVE